MKMKTLIKTSAALLAFLTLSNCYLDGDYPMFDDGIGRSSSRASYVTAEPQTDMMASEVSYPSI